MNKLTKTLKNKKGFTLMEVIVVLIILAVLAAALIPTFLGFVNQARHATAISEARLGMTAAQAVVTDSVGRDQGVPSSDEIVEDPRFAEFLGGDALDPTSFSEVEIAGNRVTGIVYTTNEFVVTITYDDGTVVTDAP